MFAAADLLRTQILKAFNYALQIKLAQAKAELERETFERLRDENRALDLEGDEDEDDYEAELDFKPDAKVSAVEIFSLLDVENIGEIDLTQFERLFEVLDFPLSDDQKERLFAYCDVEGTGVVTEKEFEEGWDQLAKSMLEAASLDLGLSDRQIIAIIVVAVLILVLLFVFIFLALSGWYSEDSFQAIVQTALIAGSGKATESLRRRSKAEDKDKLNEIVDEFVDNQEEASTAD